jgi:hypothetical protein
MGMRAGELLRRVKLIVWTEAGDGNPSATLTVYPSGGSSTYRDAWLARCAIWQYVTDSFILKIDQPDNYYGKLDDASAGFCRGQRIPGMPGVRRIIPGCAVSAFTGPAAPDSIEDAADYQNLAAAILDLTQAAGTTECFLDWESALKSGTLDYWTTQTAYDGAAFEGAMGDNFKDQDGLIHYPSRIGDYNGVDVLNRIRVRMNPRYIAFWPNSPDDFTAAKATDEQNLRGLASKYVFPNISLYKTPASASVQAFQFNLFEYALKSALMRNADTPEVTLYVPMSNFEAMAQRVKEIYDTVL